MVCGPSESDAMVGLRGWAVNGEFWKGQRMADCDGEGRTGHFRAQPEGWTTNGIGYVVHASAWVLGGVAVACAERGPDSPTGQARGGLRRRKTGQKGLRGGKKPRNPHFGAPRPSLGSKKRRKRGFWGPGGAQTCHARGVVGVFQAQPEGWTTYGVEYVVHASAWGL